MRLTLFKNTVLLFIFLGISCRSTNGSDVEDTKPGTEVSKTDDSATNQSSTVDKPILIGANQIGLYLPLLKDKRIGIVANQTSVLSVLQRVQIDASTMGSKMVSHHLVDYLHDYNGIEVKKVFAPEHGFRGNADAGEVVKDGLDTKTGLPIVSLYGKNKKPSKSQLQDLDLVVFDIQDVGARFYTYISSLHYVMEACAENNVPLLILDRPNPNGHYIDGPILELAHKSFVGMHPVPVVHGMTIGEYAKMVNGEDWLANGAKCDITVIPMKNYSHEMAYSLPIKPSPNLPNDVSINLYPSLCFFEGTSISVGRGTSLQFQIYGSPFLPPTNYSFTPQPNHGAKYPKHENKVCHGYDLSNTSSLNGLNLNYLINAYNATVDKDKFFNSNGFFTKLAGTKKLRQQIEDGLTEAQIKATWKSGLDGFKKTRASYLLYD